MDDLSLNRTVAPPRSSGGGRRIFILAIAIAAGLHLLVFGALALSLHSHKAPSPAAPPPIAASTVAQPAAAVAPAASESNAPALPPTAPHPHSVKPVLHVPAHAHPVVSAKPAKAKIKVKPAKTKSAKFAAKPVVRHAPAHGKAKSAGALDLNALSQFKSSGK